MINVVFESVTQRAMQAYLKENEEFRQVVTIGYDLDIGDIRGGMDMTTRADIFKKLDVLGILSDEDRTANLHDCCMHQERLLSAAQNGERIRVFVSEQPHSLCGFAFVCDCLRDIVCDVMVVRLPGYRLDWGMEIPSSFVDFLSKAEALSAEEKQYYSDRWRTLQTENAPLRTIVNGCILSVEEDFYDPFILSCVPDGGDMIAQVLRVWFERYQKLGITIDWYYYRMCTMVDNGLLEWFGEPNEDINRRWIRKVL